MAAPRDLPQDKRRSRNGRDLLTRLSALRAETLAEQGRATGFASFAVFFACASIAAIVPFLPRYPLLALTCIPLLLITASARKALFAARARGNRRSAFALFRILARQEDQKNRALADLSWEAALRAYRVVAPVFHRHIYKQSPLLRAPVLRRPAPGDGRDARWYRAPTQGDTLSWQDARPVAAAQRAIDLILLCAAAPLLMTGGAVAAGLALPTAPWTGHAPGWPLSLLAVLILPAAFAAAAFVCIDILRARAETNVIEHGLYSVDAATVLWRAVAKAHCEVVLSGSGEPDYGSALSDRARDAAARIDDIFAWLDDRRFRERLTLDETLQRTVELRLELLPDGEDLLSPPLHIDPFRGELSDLSVDGSGVGLFADLAPGLPCQGLERIAAGAEIILALPAGRDGQTIPLKGTVKNITALGEQRWRLGIALTNNCRQAHCVHRSQETPASAGRSACVLCDHHLVQQWYRRQREGLDVLIES